MIIARMPNSQRMALIDCLIELMRRIDTPEVFIDCSQSPPVETRPGDLIRLLSEAPEEYTCNST